MALLLITGIIILLLIVVTYALMSLAQKADYMQDSLDIHSGCHICEYCGKAIHTNDTCDCENIGV